MESIQNQVQTGKHPIVADFHPLSSDAGAIRGRRGFPLEYGSRPTIHRRQQTAKAMGRKVSYLPLVPGVQALCEVVFCAW